MLDLFMRLLSIGKLVWIFLFQLSDDLAVHLDHMMIPPPKLDKFPSNLVVLVMGRLLLLEWIRERPHSGFPCNRTNIAEDRSWSNLPFDILSRVADRMKGNLSDLVRFSAVCKSWRCLIHDSQWFGFAQQREALTGMSSLHLPKLMLPEKTDSDNRYFIEWSMHQIFQLYLPEAQGRRYCGSGHGWLVTVGEDMDIHLLNPMTREQVRLPSHPLFTKVHFAHPDNCIRKAIIIGNPSESVNCTVAAIIFANLYLVKPGRDEAWTRVRSRLFLTDIAHNQGLVYGLALDLGNIECWRLDPVQILWVSVSRSPIPDHILNIYSHFISYCLEASGELIGVSRPSQLDDTTVLGKGSLVVYKLMDKKKWVEVKDLGDCCLFLGENTSMALSPVPPNTGFWRNCIYFTHSRYLEVEIGRYDMSIYSLEDGLYKPFSFGGSASQPSSPSLWVTFNPCNGVIN